MNPEESIRTALSVLFPEGSVVELRALGERTHYGYYTDFDRLARDAAVLDSTSGISGIYITLNQVHSDLLSRCANRMKRAGQREPQTSDGESCTDSGSQSTLIRSGLPGYPLQMQNMLQHVTRQKDPGIPLRKGMA